MKDLTPRAFPTACKDLTLGPLAELTRRLFNVTRSAISTGAERDRRLVEGDGVLQAKIRKATKYDLPRSVALP